MCFYKEKLLFSKPLIAGDGGILCIKEFKLPPKLLFTPKGKNRVRTPVWYEQALHSKTLEAPIYTFTYEVGVTYTINNRVWGVTKRCRKRINYGFHSYNIISEGALHRFHPPDSSHRVFAVCGIPEGTEYYQNHTEYVSKSIKVIRVLNDKDMFGLVKQMSITLSNDHHNLLYVKHRLEQELDTLKGERK